jgi:hypothetical protein
MLASNDQTPESPHTDPLSAVAGHSGAAANGTPEQPAGPLPDSTGAPDPAVARVDGLANRVGYVAAAGTRQVATLLSRTREAFQDFWAEVQDYRHGRKP